MYVFIKLFFDFWTGKDTHIGLFDVAKEAGVAYDRAVLKANKSTTLLNFPDMVHNLDVEPFKTYIARPKKKKVVVAKKKKIKKSHRKEKVNDKKKGINQAASAIGALLALSTARS